VILVLGVKVQERNRKNERFLKFLSPVNFDVVVHML